MTNNDFIKNFLSVSDKVHELGKTITWDIPETADKNRGDFGLLPEDVSIGAWQIPPSSAQMLRFMVLATKAKTILELGTSIGFSTMWLALGAKENGGHVYGTEIFEEKADLAEQNLKEAGVNDLVTILRKDILEVLKEWETEKKIDFVFMDADKQRYDQYLEKLIPLLSDNGVIMVDNVGNYPQHMQPFLDMCKARTEVVVHFLNIDFGLLMIVKSDATNLFGDIGIQYNAR